MERKPVVVCPSKGRAKNVKTTKLIPDLILVVPASEAADYREHNPGIDVIGIDEKGIVATRQWIIENYDDVFMIDDDVVSVKNNFADKGDEAFVKDPEVIRDIIEQTAFIAEQVGAKFYGFASIRNPNEFVSQKVLRFSGYLNGSYSGFVKGHGLNYPVGWREAEDHYISLLNAYKNRKSFIETRWSFVTDGNFTAMGGCNDDRTIDKMKWHTIELKKLFGNAVSPKLPSNNKKSVNEGERSISIPF